MIQLHRFAANNILRVTATAQGMVQVPFLNWHVSQRRLRERGAPVCHFYGSGLYGVCFRGRLVYIGSYCGQKPTGVTSGAYFTGDIAKNRWWQHFGSMSARSHKLHVARQLLADLRASLGEHPMLLALAQAGPAIHTDRGCLGAENRLRFAIRNWPRFIRTTPELLMKQFSFIYARDDGSRLECTPTALKASIDAAETEAIKTLQPEVNTEKRSRTAPSFRLSPRRALLELRNILDKQLRQYRTASPQVDHPK